MFSLVWRPTNSLQATRPRFSCQSSIKWTVTPKNDCMIPLVQISTVTLTLSDLLNAAMSFSSKYCFRFESNVVDNVLLVGVTCRGSSIFIKVENSSLSTNENGNRLPATASTRAWLVRICRVSVGLNFVDRFLSMKLVILLTVVEVLPISDLVISFLWRYSWYCTWCYRWKKNENHFMKCALT